MNNIDEIKKYARINHIPVLLNDSAKYLSKLITQKKPSKILEIGTAIGYSGSIMLFSNPQSKLITIEKDEKSYEIAKENFCEMGLNDRVTMILGDGYEAILKLKQDNNKFDFIFLDGPKGQYIKYYNVLLDILTDDGCLLVDNVLFRGLVRSNKDVGHKKRAMINKLRQFLFEIEK